MSDAEVLLKRAKSALLARDYALATRLYKTLIAENPDEIEYKMQLGNLYVKSGRDDQALDVFKQVEKKVPENIEVLMAMSGIYRRQKKYDESVAILEQALTVGTDSPKKHSEISYNLGFTYRLMGNYTGAIKCFEDVVEENPKDVLTYNHLGAIYALQGKYDKAIESFQRGLKFDPNHPVLLFNMAESFAKLGDTSKGLAFYEAALRSKPGWNDAIEAYANLLLTANRVKEADDVVSGAIAINPDDTKILTAKGNVYNRQSVFDDAESEFKKALNGDKEYKAALTGLAHSQERLGKFEEAVATIKKAGELNPEDLEIFKKSAHILLSANKPSSAYAFISKLWENDKTDPHTVSLLGQYYICKGEVEKLAACLKKIKEIAPDYKDAYREWGYRFMQKGDVNNAEKYLQNALAVNSKDSESMVYLAELFEKQNRLEEAFQMYRKASEADVYNHLSKKAEKRLSIENPDLNDTLSQNVNQETPEIEQLNDENVENAKTEGLFNSENGNEGEETVKAEDVQSEENASDDKLFSKNDDKETADAVSVDVNDEEFDFEQFGMDNLIEPDKEDVVSIDDLMKMDEMDSKEGNPADFEQLVDDGAPVDEDDELGFSSIPDGMDDGFEEEDIGDDFFQPEVQPETFASDGFEEEPEAEAEKPVSPQAKRRDELVSTEDEPVYLGAQEKPAPVKSPELDSIEDSIDELEDRISKMEKLADRVNEAAEKALEAAAKTDENLEKTSELVDEKLEEFKNSDFFDANDETKAETESAPEEEAEIAFDEPEPEIETEQEVESEQEIENEQESEIEDEPVYESENELNDEQDEEPEAPLSPEPETESASEEEEISADELMLRRAIEMLPSIVSAIENRDMLRKFESLLETFKKLREMLDFLPEKQRKEFLTSKNRILLDYVISKLSGRPGLFATATALRNSGLLQDTPDLKPSDSEGLRLVTEVFHNLRELSQNLEDENLRIALDREALNLIEKL